MKSPRIKATVCLLVGLSATALIAPFSGAKDEKLKPEELIAKHLDSIGPAEKRQAVKSRTTVGTVQVAFRVGGSGTLNGKANLLSQGSYVRLGFVFPAIDYPGEQLAFNGEKVTAGQSSPGNYPPFSRFVYENDILLKEGMLFGSLSTGWTLLDATKKPRLDSNGLKKIDGRQLLELKYVPRNPKNNIQAWYYFDPETYRHVRSQIKLELPTTQVSRISDTAELVRYSIMEQFDDFKPVDGLTLPHSHKIEFTVDSPRGGLVTTWAHMIDRIVHDETIERPLFSLQ
jgi:hypothetical protein